MTRLNTQVEKTKIQLTIEHIRKISAEGKLMRFEELRLEPISLENEEIAQFVDTLNNNHDYSDIKTIKGSADAYYYSSKGMTEGYAKIAARIEDKDILRTIAETVRSDSRVYPRPTDLVMFYAPPFHYSKEEVRDSIKRMKEVDEYRDIQESKASNGVVYIYSNNFLSKAHADSLTEYIEVIQKEMP